jgi:hypothetical protein
MMIAIHAQRRDCMATTAHNYNTHGIDNYGMLKFHRRCKLASKVRGHAEVQCRDKTILEKDSRELRRSMEESQNNSGDGFRFSELREVCSDQTQRQHGSDNRRKNGGRTPITVQFLG